MVTAAPVPLFDVQFGEGSTTDYLLWAQLVLGENRTWARNRWETTYRFCRTKGIVYLSSPRGFIVRGQTFSRAKVTLRVLDRWTVEVLSIEGLNE